MKARLLLIFLWLLGSGLVYYGLTEERDVDRIVASVEGVVDGDTITLEGDRKVRLLGINTPERKMPFYSEAKEYLAREIEGARVEVEVLGTDQYGRLLGHVFYGGVHMNKEMLTRGFATLFYYGKDQHYNALAAAEASARDRGVGIWKRSSFASCVELVSLQYKEHPKRCTNTEQLVLRSSCGQDLQLLFKDDASHIYRELLPAGFESTWNFSCTFNDAGDSLYVWDSQGLVLFHRY